MGQLQNCCLREKRRILGDSRDRQRRGRDTDEGVEEWLIGSFEFPRFWQSEIHVKFRGDNEFYPPLVLFPC